MSAAEPKMDPRRAAERRFILQMAKRLRKIAGTKGNNWENMLRECSQLADDCIDVLDEKEMSQP